MSAGLAAAKPPPQVFWLAFAVIVLARLAWFVHYAYITRGQWRAGRHLRTSELSHAASDEERAKRHQSVAAMTDQLIGTSLLVGTLALAAWTALFAVAYQGPGRQVSATSRSLLLVGAAVLIAAPTLVRGPDRYISYLARRSDLYIGLSAVGLALASLANDLLGGVLRLGVVAVAVSVLVIRDVWDSCTEIQNQVRIIGPRFARRPAATTVKASEAQWHEVEDAAYLVVFSAVIINMTDKPIKVRWMWLCNGLPDRGPPSAAVIAALDRERQAVWATGSLRLEPGEIEPHSSIEGQRAEEVLITAGSGKPRCTFIVMDTEGKTYATLIPSPPEGGDSADPMPDDAGSSLLHGT